MASTPSLRDCEIALARLHDGDDCVVTAGELAVALDFSLSR
ncbi:MAG: hypothetical protein QF366_05615 [Candidatus Poseidoniia archaeon]|nr:hypothetical protein [Candidatus Poseidoniia archaeon]MDP6847093.1 hypothetical protein [Candidatus Poseidoniia archaeon]